MKIVTNRQMRSARPKRGRFPIAGAVMALATLLACGTAEVASVDGQADECTAYPPAAQSPYVLPYPPGTQYRVLQGNCTRGGHQGRARYSYDFEMPIGTIVTAARAGIVSLVIEHFADGNGVSGEANLIRVKHGDGTFADYVHLTQDGALLDVGASVARGDAIALSGNTGGSTGPHLHFSVNLASDCVPFSTVVGQAGCMTLPVTFSNTREHPAGLVEGETYAAEPY